MTVPASASLPGHFAGLKDLRQSWKVLYPSPEVLLAVLCGTLAGAEDVVEIRRWGGVNQDLPRRFLPYAAGIPSHGTLNDLIDPIDDDLFARCFSAASGPEPAPRPWPPSATCHQPHPRRRGQTRPQGPSNISRLGHSYLEHIIRQSA